jgi:hypothetical protein
MDTYAIATGQATKESINFQDTLGGISKLAQDGKISITDEAQAMWVMQQAAASGDTSLGGLADKLRGLKGPLHDMGVEMGVQAVKWQAGAGDTVSGVTDEQDPSGYGKKYGAQTVKHDDTKVADPFEPLRKSSAEVVSNAAQIPTHIQHTAQQLIIAAPHAQVMATHLGNSAGSAKTLSTFAASAAASFQKMQGTYVVTVVKSGGGGGQGPS